MKEPGPVKIRNMIVFIAGYVDSQADELSACGSTDQVKYARDLRKFCDFLVEKRCELSLAFAYKDAIKSLLSPAEDIMSEYASDTTEHQILLEPVKKARALLKRSIK